MNTIKAEVIMSDWANWIAIDKNGVVCEFENEPDAILAYNNWDISTGNFKFLYSGKPPKNWKLELYTYG